MKNKKTLDEQTPFSGAAFRGGSRSGNARRAGVVSDEESNSNKQIGDLLVVEDTSVAVALFPKITMSRK